jgi:hypothetical protein
MTPDAASGYKENGNRVFKAGQYPEVWECYRDGIRALSTGHRDPSSPTAVSSLNHNLALLYSNRSACSLKMSYPEDALNDALESVGYDRHWYKVSIYFSTIKC